MYQNILWYYSVLSSAKELNNNRNLLPFAPGKKQTFTFLFLESSTSLTSAIIESPTINDVPGFHSSTSALLSGFLNLFNTSNSMVGSIDKVHECSVDI